ncbi:hypothetical protein [Oscillatoria salina]|uniref:hypothetical protein n=1 Tax=Oscillatoria salina TaxID=331517 RepID=UPI0013BD58BE|nr:hypothetical protein [Oscillatoria salina]MBZ8182579.1 hypothetical protein [Oscillatoria salina IIICB1]NET90026.1 hypothetical protein [Kamptonema sp. SIO1D9]
MDTQTGFIGKVLFFSVILSVLIKYGGRVLPIAPSNTNAAIAICIPALVLTIALLWRIKS